MHDIALSKEELKKLGIVQRTPGMASYFNDELIKYHNKFLFDEMKVVAQAAAKAINFPLKKILASRSFLHFPVREELHKKYDNVHVDHEFDHLVCLYYVNNTDGDTVLFKSFHGDKVSLSTIEEHQRVSPKKGRCILFNGTRFHSSTPPTKDIRCIANYTLL